MNPFKSINELPQAVKNELVPEMQKIWKDAFNSALKNFNDEKIAAAFAWGSIRRRLKEDLGEQTTPYGKKGSSRVKVSPAPPAPTPDPAPINGTDPFSPNNPGGE